MEYNYKEEKQKLKDVEQDIGRELTKEEVKNLFNISMNLADLIMQGTGILTPHRKKNIIN